MRVVRGDGVATEPPVWVQWAAALSSPALVLVTVVLAWLTYKYVKMTGTLADVASRQLADVAQERDRARASTRRALTILAEHLLKEVNALALSTAYLPRPLEYPPLLQSSLPRMAGEISDLISLARDVGDVELEKAHDAATALSDLGKFAARAQSGVGVQLLGTEQEALPKRIATAREALEWLRSAGEA